LLQSKRLLKENFDELNSNAANVNVIKAALVAGLYPNLIRIDRANKSLITDKELKTIIHKSSVVAPQAFQNESFNDLLANSPFTWLAFDGTTLNGTLSCLRSCSLVPSIAVALFAGQIKVNEKLFDGLETYLSIADKNENLDDVLAKIKSNIESKGFTNVYKVDSTFSFNSNPMVSSLLLNIKIKWNHLLLRKIKEPLSEWSLDENKVLQTVVQLLNSEEIDVVDHN